MNEEIPKRGRIWTTMIVLLLLLGSFYFIASSITKYTGYVVVENLSGIIGLDLIFLLVEILLILMKILSRELEALAVINLGNMEGQILQQEPEFIIIILKYTRWI